MEIPVVDVLIVGGGPVGLFMANELARHGVKSFRILEKLPAVSGLSKAVAVHARSLEVVPRADKFLAQGLKCRAAAIYAGAKRLAHVSMDKVHSEYQFALMLPQDETEQIFLDNLKEAHGVSVERSYEVTSLVEFTRTSADNKEETLVRVTAKNLTSNTEEVILARYVIGCDGARSLVRKTMKANFVGVTVNDAWLTADCQIKEDFPSPSELTTVIHEKGFVAFFPLKEQERRFRIAINFGDNFNSAMDKEYTLEELQDIVNERSAAMGQHVTLYNPRWISLFKLNERRVETMRKSRLMVCGDAAHVHTPAGGQGMNTGIQDAHNLAWKLALVLKGHGKEEILLDSFSFEREHNADNVLKNTAKMRTLISTNSKILIALRNTLLPIVSEIDAVRENLSNNMGQMDISYPQSPLTSHYGEPRGFFKLFKSNSPSQFLGGRLPYFHLTHVADAKSKSSHDIVKATTKHHVFLLDDEGEHKSVEQLQTKLKEAKLDELIQTEVITNSGSHVEGVQVWRDDTKEFHKAFHLEEHSKGLAVLVRPDGYIGFISGLAAADIDAVVSHLKNYLL